MRIQQARNMIAKVAGKHLSVSERCARAIDLAAIMLEEAQATQTHAEKKIQGQLARMMNDPVGKVFTTNMTDQCFRSNQPSRVADQLTYTLKKFGIPKYLSIEKQLQLFAFQCFGNLLPNLFVPIAKHMVRKETSSVILPGEPEALIKHLQHRRGEGVRLNLNHLGEAILGEQEAERRLEIYLNDLANPQIEYISVKISTICSQLNLLSWEETLSIIMRRLKDLYRAARDSTYIKPDGKKLPKFVNLDMEEYRDLYLTVEAFRRVLDETEFQNYSAGIVLQSYLPDSFLIQKELTEWAKKRVASGRGPIKIRIVKGANLAMERVEASLHGWPEATYDNKADVDANYKRMVTYGCEAQNACAAHLGIASHNLFDVAYAMLLRSENRVEEYVCFEMLEGMADHMRRVVQKLSGDMLLYCPTATRQEFQNAVAYLVRRLDENTAPSNFLRHTFGLRPGTKDWIEQASLFAHACTAASSVSNLPRRTQDRRNPPKKMSACAQFRNEPDTDWTLPQNRLWAESILKDWSTRTHNPIPLVIGNQQIVTDKAFGVGEDPSFPGKPLYQYSLATSEHVDLALKTAKNAEKPWAEVSVCTRVDLLARAAQTLRQHRADLIGVMVADTGKTIPEADVEVSEAIDFAEYYRFNLQEIMSIRDIAWNPKGTVLVAPPWNFPCSIPAGGILAALAAGNCVLFKPATEAILVGWELVQALWEAGISKEVLQFITCEDEPIGSQLIKDKRIDAVVLTGGTSTAKLFLKLRPGLDLLAETGGKNALIVTALADRDLAVRDTVQSAFGHAGQKCSACSLAICEAEVYDDPRFRMQLRDAAASWRVGSPWELSTRLNPLIRTPNPTLLRGLTELEKGEEWLLEPKQDPSNPNLWSPGIKLGVKPSSFSYQNELFGPVLCVMRADDLKHAVQLANGTPYGLTSGLHSLDDREQHYWMKHIEAGNCYINRGITGAIVQRQPFGGCKESGFGPGAKAGGPNYLMQLMHPTQTALPTENETSSSSIQALTQHLEKAGCSATQLQTWHASIESYAFYWRYYFSQKSDPSRILGQDNFLRYVPHALLLRLDSQDQPLDLLRIIAAAKTCNALLTISGDATLIDSMRWLQSISKVAIVKESEQKLIGRLKQDKIRRLRLLHIPSNELQAALAEASCTVEAAPVLANGRIELLRYLREVSISIDYHRYGNLGARENEERS